MKKILMVLSIAVLTIACVDKNDVMTDSQKINLNNAITTKEYTIPVQSGMVSIVVAEDSTLLAVDTVATHILVPSGTKVKTYTVKPELVDSMFNVLNIKQDDGTENDYFKKPGSYQLWQTVAFEDMIVGDCDYNDLVIHCRYQTKNSQNGGRDLRIGIQPIALGGTLRLKLGCDIYKGNTLLKTIYVTDNCRQDLFNGQAGYLNTQTHNFDADEINGHTLTTLIQYSISPSDWAISGALSVNWFIEVYDATGTTITNRMNSLSTHYIDNHMIDANNNPYGIVTTWTGKKKTDYISGYDPNKSGHDWFNYAMERESVKNAYSLWDSWLKTTTTTFAQMYAAAYNVFPAGQDGLYVIKSGCTDLWGTWTNTVRTINTK